MIRLAGAGAVGAGAVTGALAADAGWWVALTIGWAAASLLIVSWIWLTIGPMDALQTAQHAKAEDFSRPIADIILLTASVASLVAVGFTLFEAGSRHGGAKAMLIALAIAAVALAWATVHTVYALRYGDLYYGRAVGGIDFAGDAPDYRDFAYLAFTIGMTFQVSDTGLQTKPLRRTALRHALLSYLFGAVIVGLAINTLASLLR